VRFLVMWRLSLLLGVGALAGTWVAVAAQRRRHVVRFTSVELLDVVAPRRPGWRRHVPAVLFLVALASLVLGFAKPVRATRVGDERATVVLAVDTSLSMQADDVEPTRLDVARKAAREFVADLPGELNVGLVTFNGATSIAVAPSRDRAALTQAIDDMVLGEGTAIGEAIFTALDTVEAAPGGEDGRPAPARIVVMSDGETTMGRPNDEAADAAAAAGVPVDTIAFGTPEGTIEDPIGGAQPVPVAPRPLAEIAETTGGGAF
jgi:Ca-activated chloride channel homolog